MPTCSLCDSREISKVASVPIFFLQQDSRTVTVLQSGWSPARALRAKQQRHRRMHPCPPTSRSSTQHFQRRKLYNRVTHEDKDRRDRRQEQDECGHSAAVWTVATPCWGKHAAEDESWVHVKEDVTWAEVNHSSPESQGPPCTGGPGFFAGQKSSLSHVHGPRRQTPNPWGHGCDGQPPSKQDQRVRILIELCRAFWLETEAKSQSTLEGNL